MFDNPVYLEPTFTLNGILFPYTTLFRSGILGSYKRIIMYKRTPDAQKIYEIQKIFKAQRILKYR